MLNYWPNQVYIGNKTPDDLAAVAQPWYDKQCDVSSRYGKFGVRCNCLSLGGLFNNQPAPFLESYAKATFLGRMAGPEDIKGIVVYLASQASAYMTGAVIPVDGGYSAK